MAPLTPGVRPVPTWSPRRELPLPTGRPPFPLGRPQKDTVKPATESDAGALVGRTGPPYAAAKLEAKPPRPSNAPRRRMPPEAIAAEPRARPAYGSARPQVRVETPLRPAPAEGETGLETNVTKETVELTGLTRPKITVTPPPWPASRPAKTTTTVPRIPVPAREAIRQPPRPR